MCKRLNERISGAQRTFRSDVLIYDIFKYYFGMLLILFFYVYLLYFGTVLIILYIFFDSNAVVHVACERDEFHCGEGRCIPYYKRCNGYIDCFDRSDEQNCGTSQPYNINPKN